jgi:putative exporter of polyketide antibiotics
MAEIRVERKRTSLLPWILGILLLALIIWAVAESMDNDVDDAGTAVSAIGAIGAIQLSIEEIVLARAA